MDIAKLPSEIRDEVYRPSEGEVYDVKINFNEPQHPRTVLDDDTDLEDGE